MYVSNWLDAILAYYPKYRESVHAIQTATMDWMALTSVIVFPLERGKDALGMRNWG